MKITMIHGQSHKGFSYHAGNLLLEKLHDAELIHEYFMPADMKEFCTGCYVCMIKGEEDCPHYHYLKPITEAIEAADLLIFTTPVYCMHTTASMKALMDHYFTWWVIHRPKAIMYHKRAVIISAGAGAGMKGAVKDIKVNLKYWGISNIQTCCQRSQSMKWDETKPEIKAALHHKLSKVANEINKNNPVSISIVTRLMFKAGQIMQKKDWSACIQDKKYWIEKGWLSKDRPWKDE